MNFGDVFGFDRDVRAIEDELYNEMGWNVGTLC